MELKKLLKDVDVLSAYEPDREVAKIAATSADVEIDSLFVYIENGEQSKAYLDEARRKGALIVREGEPLQNEIEVSDARAARSLIWRNFYGNPSAEMSVFGVTGTNGKTTVTYLTRHILESAGRHTGVIGTVANMTGDNSSQAVQTTPAPDELYRLLSKMKGNRLTDVCMEVSSHSLDQKRTEGLCFTAGAVTNLTQDHLDYHGTMDEYLKAKLKLVRFCKAFAVNGDDSSSEAFIAAASETGVKPLIYGISCKNADVRAKNFRANREKTSFILEYRKTEYKTCINIPGRFSVYNALAAFSLAVLGGVPAEKAAAALASAKGVKGRMERIEAKNGATVIIDYAHTPDGLEKVLITLRDVREKGKIITVFGCGGDRDRTKRPLMGAIAAKYSDLVIITSDNPRTENPYSIIAEIAAGSQKSHTPQLIIEDRKTAIRTAMTNAAKGDIVLLAGKGHENYQILRDRTINFDEREILKSFI